MDYTVHGILQARLMEWVSVPFSRGPSQPRIKPRYPTLQVDPLPTEAQGKSKNTGVDSLSLPQGIFPTQESNQGLLHCRQILYQLSHQGSPQPSGPERAASAVGVWPLPLKWLLAGGLPGRSPSSPPPRPGHQGVWSATSHSAAEQK